MQFVRGANLPKACSALLYGERYADILEIPLEKLQIYSILVPDNPFVDPRLAGHSDLSLLYAGEGKFFAAAFLKESRTAETLRQAGVDLCYPQERQNRLYPHDAQFNLCISGDHVIFNPKTASEEIVDFLTNERRFVPIPCRQGYSRCACCIVDECSLITEDRGIATAAKKAGFDVLLISDSFIDLEGFPYGFLGGASFKISSDQLALTGTLIGHPDYDRIIEFLSARGMELLFLTKKRAFDIGSAIPILES